MDIVEVAKRSGLPASTLRYYEEKGLIASTGRRGLRRLFARGVLDQLALIALGQAAGFSLHEIATMLTPAGRPAIDRAMLAKKAAAIDLQVGQLRAMSRGLRHAAACPAESHAECPTFRRLLKAAATGALERRSGQAAAGSPRLTSRRAARSRSR